MLPIYNEAFSVIRDTLTGVFNLDYPREKTRVIVIDDTSEDERDERIEAFVAKHNGIYFRRGTRHGFKAGAINAAMKAFPAKYMVVLDADHIPQPHMLRTLLGAMLSYKDENILLMQGRPDFVNQEKLLHKASGFIHTQLFAIMQRSRHKRGNVVFVGTSGLIRQDLLLKEGGFKTDTIAEDTDTFISLGSKAYKSYLIDKIVTRGLVPWDPISQVRQVWRWNAGLSKSFRLRLPLLLKAKNMKWGSRIDFLVVLFLPLLSMLLWFLNFLLLFMYYQGMNIIRPSPSNTVDSALFFVAPILVTLSTVFAAIYADRVDKEVGTTYSKHPPLQRVIIILSLSIFTLTAQPFLVTAVVFGLTGKNIVFLRTPKAKKNLVLPSRVKNTYALAAIVISLFGIEFLYLTIKTYLTQNPMLSWFSMGAISHLIPIYFLVTSYKGLEKYIVDTSSLTAKTLQK